MYLPRAFREERPHVIAAAIREAQIGELVTLGPDGLEATPLPLLLEAGGPHGTLNGHLARANPQWRSFDPAIEALVTRLQAKRKLSQNRPQADIEGVMAALSTGTPTDQLLAPHMHPDNT